MVRHIRPRFNTVDHAYDHTVKKPAPMILSTVTRKRCRSGAVWPLYGYLADLVYASGVLLQQYRDTG